MSYTVKGGISLNKTTAPEKQREMISVVDDFDSSAQGEKYDAAFKGWRRNKNNQFAFNFEKNSKESVFVEGKGFDSRSLAETEKETLLNIMNIIGIALLLFVAFYNIISKIIVGLLDLAGVNVHTSFGESSFFGGSTEIVITYLAMAALSLLVPAIYLHVKLKMPFRVEFMCSLNDSFELMGAIAATLIMCVVVCVPSTYSGDKMEIFTYFKNINADVSLWGQKDFVIYTVFDVIVISILAESMLRGAVFNALRQFGDVFAVVITAVIAGLIAADYSEIPAEILISVVAGAGVLRSGSIFTAYVVRAVYKMYCLALVLIESGNSDRIITERIAFMLAGLVIGTVGYFAVLRRRKKKGTARLAAYTSEISDTKRFGIALKSFPFGAVACLCILVLIKRVLL